MQIRESGMSVILTLKLSGEPIFHHKLIKKIVLNIFVVSIEIYFFKLIIFFSKNVLKR